MTRVQIIAGLVPTIPHNDLIVPPPNHRTLPSPSSFLPINLHSIARLINDVKGVLGREPGPRHLAYCLSAASPSSSSSSTSISSSLVRNYSATMNQPSCRPFSDNRQPIIHPTFPHFVTLLSERNAYYDRWIKCTIAARVSVPPSGGGGEGKRWREGCGGLLSAALIEFGIARFRMTNARNHSRKCCIKGDINYSIYYISLSPLYLLSLD